MIPTRRPDTRPLPPRRLLATAAALALSGGAWAQNSPVGAATPPAAPEASCPLGAFHCPARPESWILCRPNALLEFYDPTLPRDSSGREQALTDVHARHVDASRKDLYVLTGDVRMQRYDELLRADRVEYRDSTTDYDARGDVRYQDAGELLAASHMHGNTAAKRGTAEDVRYQLLGSRGNGDARHAELTDADHSHYVDVSYSTCDVGHHVWEVRAQRMTIDETTGRGTARNATLRVGGVPLMYMPWFSFPVDNRRQSGFLYPTFGSSNRSGTMLALPYYLNLAPNYDATLEPRVYTRRGTMLAAEGRYLLPGTRGQLNVEYLPNDRGENSVAAVPTNGRDRWLLRYRDVSHLAGPWNFSTNVARVSDRSYLRDFSNDLYTGAVSWLQSSTYVHGGGRWWTAAIGMDSYQSVDPFLPDSAAQYKRWPRAAVNLDLPLRRWLEFGAHTEAVAFRKDHAIEGNRVDLYPYLAADWQGAAWFVRPQVGYRYTAYDLSGDYTRYGYYGRLAAGQTSPFGQRTPSRAVPITSVDSGLIFDRHASLFGQDYTQTLEPRLYYLYVPYRDQSDLPVFDTQPISFDYWQLFSTNRYSGADRQMDANNLTAAITTRLLDEDGVERLSASIGQIRYFSRQRVKMPAGNTVEARATDWSGSDYVAQLGLQLDDRWRLNGAYQWSPNTRQTDLGMVELQRRLGADGIFNFSYRYRRASLEQYDASAVVPLSARWRLLGRWTYSVRDRRTVEALAGVEYDSCCTAVRLVGRHYVEAYRVGVTTPGTARPTNNALMLEVEFKGLGAFNGQTENLLRRGILGYQ